ncbi:MAG TPA: hypothetical protein VF624_00800 [Tepidisphaeraceae bacterium]
MVVVTRYRSSGLHPIVSAASAQRAAHLLRRPLTGSRSFTEYLYEDGAVSGVAGFVRPLLFHYPKSNGTSVGSFRYEYDSTYDTGKALNRVFRVRDNQQLVSGVPGSGLQLIEYG